MRIRSRVTAASSTPLIPPEWAIPAVVSATVEIHSEDRIKRILSFGRMGHKPPGITS
jgi:hypothetical protein